MRKRTKYKSVTRASIVLALLLVPAMVNAYQVTSNFSTACHELLTIDAYNGILDDIDTSNVPLPESTVWKKLAERIAEALGIEYETPQEELILVSLVIGSRWPDLRGHSIANFVQLRDANLNPEGQSVHCLRGPEDDYEEGNVTALEATKLWIKQQVDGAVAAIKRESATQIIPARFYLDFYGEFPVDVWEPAFRLGIAAHAIEDSFVHALRDDDVTKINTILNYVDPVNGINNEERDGLPHSDSMDDCSVKGPLRALAVTVRQAMEEFYTASGAYNDGDTDAIDELLTKWMTLQRGCVIDNDYCDTPWLETAKEKLSEPYICSYAGGPIDNPWRDIAVPWGLIALVYLAQQPWRRRRKRS